ncbi:MAG: 4-demethylwyosine synthase TYW1, partial [Candidatus Diapherotrites archaeon]|nr:4-demethylwyosine synthase TYW1 [Candidatus Diapherotrites archaeon]
MVVRVPEWVEKQLKNAGYGVYNHSAVEVCSWTKKAIRGEGTCYKNKFYGIDTHRCMQMTQAVAWCTNRCVYCWRPMEFFVGTRLEGELDPPDLTMEKLRELRKKLLSGFGG